MRKNIILALAAALLVFAACDPDQGPKKVPGFFTYLGALKADNNWLPTDVVVANLKENTVSVALPSTVFADSLKNVVIRYALDSISTVTMDGEALEYAPDSLGSSKLVLDCSEPHSFILERAGVYTQYTFSMSVAASAWNKVASAPLTDTLYTSAKVAYDKSKGVFYVADQLRCKNSADQKAIVYTFDGSTLSSQIASANRVAQVNVAVGVDGKAYVAYNDYLSATSAAGVTVAEVGGSMVGDAAKVFSCGTADTPEVIPFSSTNVWVASHNNKAQTNPALAKRLLNLAQYDGSAWTNAIALTGRSTTNYGYYTKSAIVDKTAYLLVMNQNVSNVSIYKNDGNGWSTIAEELSAKGVDGADITGASTLSFYVNFAPASDGSIYLSFQCKFDGTNWGLAVEKLSADGKTLSLVGVVPGLTTAKGGLQTSIALDANNAPFVSYKDETTGRVYVSRYDVETAAMSVPELVSVGKATDESNIAFDKNGKPYIFVVNPDANYNLEVYTTK